MKLNSKMSASALKKAQDELCDKVLMDTKQMDMVMNNYIQKFKNGEFHSYSMRNIILASAQLFARTGETIELLAPYKRWNKVNRNVKKGEKALYILAPIFYEKENKRGEKEKKMYFKKVPVFDLSQTDGEKFEIEYIKYDGDLTFENISKNCNIKINISNKEITRGYTDGKEIWISKHISDTHKICVLFHEMAHYYLHFNEDRESLDTPTKELEAEAISYMISSSLGIKNEESGAYIRNWAGNNSPELIKNKGGKIIKTCEKIINDLKLFENEKE